MHRCAHATRPTSRASEVVPRVDTPTNAIRPAAIRTLGCLAVSFTLTGIPATAVYANPWESSLQGLVDIRARGSEANTTLLVPEPDRIGVDDSNLSVTTAAGLLAWNGAVAVSGAGRLFARTAPPEGEHAVRLHVDELHAEYAVTPEHFLYAGRRHIVHGRSLGVNPLDVALEPLEQDQAKDTERRRSEIRGQDMVGFESLLGDRFTLTGYWTPGERALLAGSFTLAERKSDLTALVFGDERPGAGLSLSHTLDEGLLAYADVAVRRGRDRLVIRASQTPGAVPGAFFTEEDGASRLFAQSSLGASYTLDSGATFNLEYYFDSNGYSTGEWGEISDLIVENDRNRAEERLRETATGNLLWLSADLHQLTLRRNYGFFRAQHPDLFGRDLAAAMLVLHNLTDHSGRLSLRLEREIGPNLFLGVEGRYFYGNHLDEFALRTSRLAGSVHVTVNF